MYSSIRSLPYWVTWSLCHMLFFYAAQSPAATITTTRPLTFIRSPEATVLAQDISRLRRVQHGPARWAERPGHIAGGERVWEVLWMAFSPHSVPDFKFELHTDSWCAEGLLGARLRKIITANYWIKRAIPSLSFSSFFYGRRCRGYALGT